MKILVSDYDNTIKRHYNTQNLFKKIDFERDIKSINKFVNEGNKLIISTKKMHQIIKRELELYKIKYNFITSSNGLVTFDNKNNLIFANYLSSNVVQYIKEKCAKFYTGIEELEFFNEEGYSDIIINDKCILVYIRLKSINDLKEIIRDIRLNYPELKLSYDLIKNTIWMHNYSDKKLALEKLINLKKELNQTDLLATIGDSYDDLSLLHQYNGFTIKESEISEFFEDIKTVPNIRTLIKKIK